MAIGCSKAESACHGEAQSVVRLEQREDRTKSAIGRHNLMREWNIMP